MDIMAGGGRGGADGVRALVRGRLAGWPIKRDFASRGRVVGPPSLGSSNPLKRIAGDVRKERAASIPFPAGDTNFSMARTFGFMRDPLTLLLDAYERYGPVFAQRVFHANIVFVLGPEANHHLLVANAKNYSWRDGGYRSEERRVGKECRSRWSPFP